MKNNNVAEIAPRLGIDELVNSVPAIIWWASADSFAFEHVSQEAEALLGYPVADWTENPTFWSDHLHPEDRNWAVSFCKTAVEAGRPHEFEYRMIARDGRTVWVRDLVRTIKQPDGPPRVVGIMIDVTRRYESERDRQSFEEHIRKTKRVGALSEVASGVAHDFNNTLTVIAMHVDLMRSGASVPPDLIESLDAIKVALGQGVGLTRSLMAVSSDVPAEKKVINLREPVEEARRLIWRVLPRTTELVFDNPSAPALWINGDAAKILQLLLSVALDVRNSMLDGGTLIVALHAVELQEDDKTCGGPSRYARITVSSSNSTESSQSDEGNTEQGTLISKSPLATAQHFPIAVEIVEDHDGAFHIESTDQGSMIQIDLPCVSKPEAVPSAGDSLAKDRNCKPLILLAEADQQIREIAAAALQDAGFEVVPMPDRTALQQHFDQWHADVGLLLIDSNLPNNGAVEFLKSIRTAGHKTPCILLTQGDDAGASTQDPQLEDLQCDSIQPAALLQKPFSMHALVESIRSLLNSGGTVT